MSDQRYDESVRAVVARAKAEAQRRGDRRLGTDHLLVGTLDDPRACAALGVTAAQARERIDALDRDALAAIGLDIERFVAAPTAALPDRIPLSSGAREVLHHAVAGLPPAKGKRTLAERVLLALLERERPDPAAVLLDELGVPRAPLSPDMKGPQR